MKRFALIFALILATPASAIVPGEMFDDPIEEARAREIGRQLRCVVCQNQSIFDSNAGLAHDLRVVVRERMVAGDSDEEILAYVQHRFGDYVLLNPPVDTHTYVLWSAPIAFLFLGGLGAALYLRAQASRPEDEEALS
ncbi:MAG: cytochrome c-type biogenesis protein CcmH [Dinoroseobacter sp.]|nr:cytochrome c-type biogenesis protein CcmH [Dinoroseobacter sp.]